MIEIPPADADGYWHYTYVTYHPDTGEWYGGKHSTQDLNDGYAGSGHWVRRNPDRAALISEITQFFGSEDEAYAAEAALITTAIINTDPFCRNALEGGCGISREGVMRLRADPEFRRRHTEMLRLRATDPEYRRRHHEAVIRLAATPEWKQKHLEAMRRLSDNPEWKRNRAKAMAALHSDREYKQRLLKSWRDSPKWKQATRAANAKKAADPAWRQKMREVLTERNRHLGTDPEWMRKIHERNANPEYQRKKREGVARYHAKRRAEREEHAAD